MQFPDPPSAVLMAYLMQEQAVNRSFAGSVDWQGTVGGLLDGDGAEDNAVSVIDTMGRSDGRIQRTGERIEHPGFQFTVRALDYPTGWDKINQIAVLLDQAKFDQIRIGPRTYMLVAVKRRMPMYLGIEQENRRRVSFTLNGIATIKLL